MNNTESKFGKKKCFPAKDDLNIFPNKYVMAIFFFIFAFLINERWYFYFEIFIV